MDILQLQYFQTIARLENITKASELLYVAQPNLSVSIKRLEQDLGVALFDRRKGKIRLTPTGKVFLSYVDGILGQLDEGIAAARMMQQRGDEQVRVASTIVDLMGNLLEQYFPTHGNVSFHQLNCRNQDVAEKVLDQEADFGFVFGLPAQQGLEYIQIDECERVVQLSVRHPLAEKKLVSLAELNDYPMICNHSRDDADLLAEISHSKLFHPEIRYRCDDNRVEISMLTCAGGISIAPLSNFLKLKNGVQGGEVTYLRIREEIPPARLGMIRCTGQRLSLAALQFYEMVTRFFLNEYRIAQEFTETMPPR